MRKKSCFLLVIFLLCAFATNVNAQDAVVVNLTMESDYATPSVDGTYHVVEGTEFNYEVYFKGPENIVKEELKWEYSLILGTNTTNKTGLSYDLDKGIEVIPIGKPGVGEYQCKLTGTIEYQVEMRDEKKDSTYLVTKTQPINATHKIKVWEEVAFPEKENEHKYAVPGNDVQFGIDGYYGGYDKGWKFEWSEGNSSTNNYSFKAANVETAKTRDISLTVKNLAPDGKSVWGEKSYTFTITVYPSISFPEEYTNERCALPGHDVHLGINGYSGGYDKGWKFEWSEGNSNSDKYSFKATGVDELQTRDIELTIRNFAPDGVTIWGEKSYIFTVKVYPSINVEEITYDKDVYYGEDVTLGVDFHGGKTDGWDFEWKNLTQHSGSTYSYTAEDNGNSKNVATYKLVVTNSYETPGDWFKKEYTFTITEWSWGNAHLTDISDVLSGSKHQYLAYNNGYTNGWDIKWFIDGEEQTNFSNTEKSCKFENYTSEYIEKEIEIVVKNSINENKVSYLDTLRKKVNVWPKESLPTRIDNVETFIREGNETVLEVVAATGGYYNNEKQTWFYTWSRNNSTIDSDNNKCTVVAMTDKTGKTKYTEKVTYGLNIYNISPQGNKWITDDLTQDVLVYRRPKTPLKLQRKGNGSSCMFIISTEYSDEELEEYEYEFIYGYTDARGVEHMTETTTNRYMKFDEDIYNNPSNTFWALAQWEYTDALVTSGKCYANGYIDEKYDASVYGATTRGGQTSINEVSCLDFGIKGNRLNAEFKDDVTVTVNVYNLTGALVKLIHYPASSSFNEIIDLDELERGIYVIEACAADMRIVNKVVVD